MKQVLDKTALYSFLRSKGFKMKRAEYSEYFSDYFEISASKFIQIRILQDKSLQSIDISSVFDKENWYDLSLIKMLIINKEKPETITPISEMQKFLIDNFQYIQDLFNKQNYPETRNRLDELRNIRMRRMFPDASRSRETDG
jgi:hypothetical protein